MPVGDIVIAVSADVGALQSGASKGVSALASMEREGKKLQAQLDRIGEAGVEFQRQVAAFAGVSDKMANSARASAQAFEAFDQAKAKVDAMRASFDPLFAASQRYEQALRELDAALDLGSISAAEHARMMDLVGNAYLRADAKAGTMGTGLGFLGNVSSGTQQKLQQVGFQVQDFAVQVGAGTSATQAFAQQFPQLAGAFGPVGIAVGTLAAVGIPLLVAAFGSGKSSADVFGESLNKLEASISRLHELTDFYTNEGLANLQKKYGEIDQNLLGMIARQMEFQSAVAQMAAMQAVDELASQFGVMGMALDAVGRGAVGTQTQIAAMSNELGLTTDQTKQLARAMQEAAAATPGIDQANALAKVDAVLAQSNISAGELRGKLQDAEDQLRQLAAATPAASWLNAAIEGVNALIGRLSTAKAVKDSLSGGIGISGSASTGTDGPDAAPAVVGGTNSGTGSFTMPSGGGGGGGGSSGGGTDPLFGDLEALQDSLKSAAQLELESFASRQATLDEALERRLISTSDHMLMLEQMQAEHGAKMSELDVWQHGTALAQAQTFFGDMATALSSGNERMKKISEKFAAAEALINAWRAFSQTMADPSLPFFAKIPAALGVLSAGMQAVSALGGNTGGAAPVAGGGGSTGGSTGGQSAGTYLNFSFTGGMSSSEEMGRFMVDAINRAVENGAVIAGARIA